MTNRLLEFVSLIAVVIASFITGLLYRDYLSHKQLPPNVQHYLTNLICPTIPETSSKVIYVSKSQPVPVSTPKLTPIPKAPIAASFTGPQLFDAINTRRREYGVNPLGNNDTFCSLASYRLNQLLPLKTIDNHAGFVALSTDPNSPFADLFKHYTVAEFLAFIPYGTATDAVTAWDNTLGHRILLNGGQFTIGCAYAQQGIGVAIAGY